MKTNKISRNQNIIGFSYSFIVLIAVILSIFNPFAKANAEETVSVELGKSIVLPFSQPLESVFVSDDAIADISVSANETAILFGRAVGETNLILTPLSGPEVSMNVIVTHNITELKRILSDRFPGEAVEIKSARGSLLVGGVVSSEPVRSAVVATLAGGVVSGEVVDQLTVTNTNLVRLKVQLLEVNRDRAQDFGIDWDLTIANSGFSLSSANQGQLQFGFDTSAPTGTFLSFSAQLDLLISNGVATVVQETTLAAVSGESAALRVGAEFPLPRFSAESENSQGSNFSIDYRFIGTDLQFTPTFSNSEKLRLVVDTMLSDLQPNVSTINGNNFPINSTRSFSTTVELKDRQPFAIAGLSRDVTNAFLRDSTGSIASDVVNTVFGKDRLTGSSQELTVIVTPILSDTNDKRVDPQLLRPSGNLEYILSRGSRPTGSAPLGAGTTVTGFKY